MSKADRIIKKFVMRDVTLWRTISLIVSVITAFDFINLGNFMLAVPESTQPLCLLNWVIDLCVTGICFAYTRSLLNDVKRKDPYFYLYTDSPQQIIDRILRLDRDRQAYHQYVQNKTAQRRALESEYRAAPSGSPQQLKLTHQITTIDEQIKSAHDRFDESHYFEARWLYQEVYDAKIEELERSFVYYCE